MIFDDSAKFTLSFYLALVLVYLVLAMILAINRESDLKDNSTYLQRLLNQLYRGESNTGFEMLRYIVAICSTVALIIILTYSIQITLFC